MKVFLTIIITLLVISLPELIISIIKYHKTKNKEYDYKYSCIRRKFYFAESFAFYIIPAISITTSKDSLDIEIIFLKWSIYLDYDILTMKDDES